MAFDPACHVMQDNPVVDDMKATLEYDLTAPLACPRWVDGYQHFAGVVYEAGLAVIVDVRCGVGCMDVGGGQHVGAVIVVVVDTRVRMAAKQCVAPWLPCLS